MTLSFECAIRSDKDTIIFPAWDYDMIYTFDLNSGKCKCLEGYLPEKVFNGPKYGAICECKRRFIILAPLFSGRVYIHDLKEHHGTYIDLKSNVKMENWFFESFVYENYVYMLPGNYDAIVKINLLTNETIYYRDIVSDIREKGNSEICFRHGYALYNNYAFVPCFMSDAILKINLRNDEFKIISTRKHNLLMMRGIEKYAYALASDGNVLKINLSNDEINVISKLNIDNTCLLPYSELAICKDKIVIFPWKGDKIYILSLRGGYQWDEIRVGNLQCLCSISDLSNVFAYSYNKRKMLQINIETSKVEKFYPIYDDEKTNIDFKVRHSYFNNNILYERNANSISEYIKFIQTI